MTPHAGVRHARVAKNETDEAVEARAGTLPDIAASPIIPCRHQPASVDQARLLQRVRDAHSALQERRASFDAAKETITA
jgi:hypothetical protein